MPRFDGITTNEAKLKSASGKTADLIKEYLGYIEQLEAGKAGRLAPSPGETARAVQRRLGAAAKLGGKSLVIKRAGDEVLFWAKERGTGLRRRGRPRKTE